MALNHRKKARAYKHELLARLFWRKRRPKTKRWVSIGHYAPNHSNIIGVGFGRKISSGNQVTAPEAVRVYVKKKRAKNRLDRQDVIPPEINGIPTDVIEVGPIRMFSRPTACGVSAAHYQAHPGTLGCLVRRMPDDGYNYVLSNNHVFANANAGQSGDSILQPAAADGGDFTSTIARLSWRLRLLPAGNVADAATGQLLFNNTVTPDVVGIGRVNPVPRLPEVDLSVKKSGRSSGVTVGIIAETEADIQVPMGNNIYGFVEQISIVGTNGAFGTDGDSGSLVVDAVGLQPVGLLFSGNASIAYANPIIPILEQLQLTII